MISAVFHPLSTEQADMLFDGAGSSAMDTRSDGKQKEEHKERKGTIPDGSKEKDRDGEREVRRPHSDRLGTTALPSSARPETRTHIRTPSAQKIGKDEKGKDRDRDRDSDRGDVIDMADDDEKEETKETADDVLRCVCACARA